LARDDHRSTRVAREVPLDNDLADGLVDEAPDASRRLISHERLVRAQAIVAGLHPSARRVFKLVYDDPEISHAAAARETGLSVQRVRQIICEVRSKLRVALEDDRD